MRSIARAISLLVFSLPAAGCATYDLAKAPPPPSAPVAIVYSDAGPSTWSDLPLGTYTVPHSTVIISGHQEGGSVGMLFGVVGVLAQGAVNAGIGKDAVANAQQALQINLAGQADTMTKAALASGRYGQAFATTADPAGPTLSVAPFTVITFNGNDVRPYVILKATLTPGHGGSAAWTTRYVATTGPARPLTGDGSFTADDGALLHQALDVDLKRGIAAMLDDVAHPHARDETKMIYVESAMPYIHQRMGLIGYPLSDDGTSFTYVPKVADANVIAGVFTLDEDVLHRPAAPDDKVKFFDDAP
jgi:hypothetical protein